MAQEFAIAKAALSAHLFRADPSSLSRPAVEDFFALLSSTLTQCSRPNVQKCKTWILDNITPSHARTVALGRYLAALSGSLSEDGKPSLRRRRLHILYIVSDVAHHVSKRNQGRFGDAWDAHLPGLVASAATFQKFPKHMKKLSDLVDLWSERGYFDPEVMAQVRTALTDGAVPDTKAESKDIAASVKLSKEMPYVLPSLHGDPSTPWYDLPATTWLQHMKPNSTEPMLPDSIRPIRLAAGPAESQLAAAVQDLLVDVERLFSRQGGEEDDDAHVDISELGERVVLDEITGDVVSGHTYYGWSRTFCEKMKERKNKKTTGQDRGRSRSRSSSYSPRQSISPPRPSRRRSWSRSRSPRRSASRDSRSPPRYRRRSYSRSPPRHGDATSLPQIPPIPNIPPPPAGYQGPWPPPPPLPMGGGGGGPNWFPPNLPPNMTGFPGPWGNQPAPPPPPPPQNNYQGGYGGRGGRGGYRGRGRGW